MAGKKAIVMAAIAAVVTLESGSSALAGQCGCKAKFERTKPHVNIGTIGHSRSNGRRNAQLKGFGSFSIKDRKARLGSSRTRAMRPKEQGVRKEGGSLSANLANDSRLKSLRKRGHTNGWGTGLKQEAFGRTKVSPGFRKGSRRANKGLSIPTSNGRGNLDPRRNDVAEHNRVSFLKLLDLPARPAQSAAAPAPTGGPVPVPYPVVADANPADAAINEMTPGAGGYNEIVFQDKAGNE